MWDIRTSLGLAESVLEICLMYANYRVTVNSSRLRDQ
jgi:hypothetical protein